MQEQRQEGNKEDQENGLDTTLDPVEDRNQVVASWLTSEHVALSVYFTDGELLVKSTEIKHCKTISQDVEEKESADTYM